MQRQEILSRLGIEALNDMQEAAYDTINKNADTLLLSPTGSGKTLAFLLPVLKSLKDKSEQVQCLILVPSRELALQTEQVWKKMGTGFKANAFYGGHDVEIELNNLAEAPAVIIGTPGRIADHMTRGSFAVNELNTLVLDEFDKSLALGFEEQMSFIIGKLPKLKKRILVSATAAIEVPAFTGVHTPEILDFVSEHIAEGTLDMKLVISDEKDKVNTLVNLLCHIGGESSLIFCNHREAAERAAKHLSERGIDNAYFHGGLEQMEREQTLIRFRNGSVYFMVATDLAARGLDIPDVKHIIHYHLPGSKEEFIHRNGRTARMHATGTSYLLMHKDEPMPAYIETRPEELELPENGKLPATPKWTTVYISGGKKDKVNKIDIVGFFSKVGALEKEDLGMIEVKDHNSFAAVKRNKVKELLNKVQNEKLKGKKYKIAIAK